MTKTRVGLIYGGKSSEHEVSIKTAYSILQAIDYSRYEVTCLYIDFKGEWHVKTPLSSPPKNEQSFRSALSVWTEDMWGYLQQELDVFFPVVHGPNGEDGTLQGFLEMLDRPYVGCNVLGSACGMDKIIMKRIFESQGLPQVSYVETNRWEVEHQIDQVVQNIEGRIGYPSFIKPANLGSSVGISKARNQSELKEALLLATQFDRRIIVEEYVKCRELEVGVLGNDELRASVVGEVTTTADFYDYKAKYQDQESTHIQIPAVISDEITQEIQTIAKKAFQVLDCSGLSRVDFFLNDEGKVFINEINTMPGFTPFSMYPMLFKESGIPYSDLVNELLGLAMLRYEEKKQNGISIQKLS